jgi:hypothetical protein
MPRPCTLPTLLALLLSLSVFMSRATAMEIPPPVPSTGSPLPQTALEDDVRLADDASHYHEFADGQHDSHYLEWWYFNLFDAAHGIQAIMTYAITDPDNRSGHGVAQVVAVAYTAQGIVHAIDGYAPDRFTASSAQADVQIDANAIQVLDANTYRLVGASRDGRLSWDLRYVHQGTSWFGADREAVGRLPWEQTSWLVYMPSAQVSGLMTVDGHLYPINAPGYHDHNWGEWIITQAVWNWAQYAEPGLALAIGDVMRQPGGSATMEVHGERTSFTKDQLHLRHLRWAFDAEHRHWYPLHTLLHAEHDTRRLLVHLQTIETQPLRGDLPWPLADLVIYEQTAHVDGQLWEKTAEGPWVLLVAFSGQGFKEYTAKSR